MFWYSGLGNPPQISLTAMITTLKPRTFFHGEFGAAVPKLLEGVAFKRKDPHQISLLDETVLLQYGALGFAWLSKSPSLLSLKRPLERDDIAWRLNHFSPERNSGASSVKNQDDWRKLSCMSACRAPVCTFFGKYSCASHEGAVLPLFPGAARNKSAHLRALLTSGL